MVECTIILQVTVLHFSNSDTIFVQITQLFLAKEVILQRKLYKHLISLQSMSIHVGGLMRSSSLGLYINALIF